MAKDNNNNRTVFKNVQVTEDNDRRISAMVPYGSAKREWFNKQLAAWLDFKEHTDKLASK